MPPFFFLSIRWKLLGIIILMGLVTALIVLLALNQLGAMNQRLNHIVDVSAESVRLAAEIKQDLLRVTRAEKNLILAQDEQTMNTYIDIVTPYSQSLHANLDQLRQLIDAKGKSLVDNLALKWNEWRNIYAEVKQLVRRNSNVQARELALNSGLTAYNRLEQALRDLQQGAEDELDVVQHTRDFDAIFLSIKKHNQVNQLLRKIIELHRIETNVILAVSQASMENYANTAKSLMAEIEEHFRNLQELSDTNTVTSIEYAKQAFDLYKSSSNDIISLALENSNVRAQLLANGPGQKLIIAMEKLLTEIADSSAGEMDASLSTSRQDYLTTRNFLLTSSVLGLALTTGIALLLWRSIVENIRRLANYARKVQITADLTKPVPKLGDDEIGSLGQSFEYMRQALYRQNNELELANQRLDEKNREIEQFVYTVSHDLRSPLVTCKGFIGLLKEDIEKDDRENVLDDAQRIESASDQMIHIIDDLLEISRIGRKDVVWQPVNVGAMLNELREQWTERLEQADATLEIETNIPAALGDEGALRRAFENLLSNALKYACSHPDAKIKVGGSRYRDEVRYFVKDDGPGIDAQYHKKIFELFQRLDTASEGTGLGLASVAKTMQVHRGRAWVESIPGAGATFWLALPHLPPTKT